jgi:hypothetical protein
MLGWKTVNDLSIFMPPDARSLFALKGAVLENLGITKHSGSRFLSSTRLESPIIPGCENFKPQ